MDEIVQDLENRIRTTVQSATSTMYAVNSIRQSMAASAEKKRRKEQLQKKQAIKSWRQEKSAECFGSHPFSFTGNQTDLCYFYANEKMPKTLIFELQDPDLKNAVIDTFQRCLNKGLIRIEGEDFVLTPCGMYHLNQKAFIENAQRQQISKWSCDVDQKIEAVQKSSIEYSFTGTELDLGIFKQLDSFNLKNILNDMQNLDLIEKMEINFKAWKEKGLINISNNGLTTPTDRGKRFLESSIFNQTFNCYKGELINVSQYDVGAFTPKENKVELDEVKIAEVDNTESGTQNTGQRIDLVKPKVEGDSLNSIKERAVDMKKSKVKITPKMTEKMEIGRSFKVKVVPIKAQELVRQAVNVLKRF